MIGRRALGKKKDIRCSLDSFRLCFGRSVVRLFVSSFPRILFYVIFSLCVVIGFVLMEKQKNFFFFHLGLTSKELNIKKNTVEKRAARAKFVSRLVWNYLRSG